MKYAADGNLRRTPLIGKRAISGWKLLQSQPPIVLFVLFIRVELFGVVNQVLMAVHTLLLVTWSGVDYRPMGQHRSTFVRNIEKVAVAFLTLFVF